LLAVALLLGMGGNLLADDLSRQIEKGRATVGEVRARIERLEAKGRELQTRIDAMNRQVARVAAEIDRLKALRRDARENRLLIDYRLENELKASNELSRKLSRLNRAFHENERRLREETQRLLAAYDVLIRALTEAIGRRTSPKVQNALLAELYRRRTERESYAARIRPTAPLKVYGITLDPLDGPEEILEKADLLQDSEEKLRGTIALIDRRIGELEETKQLLEETVTLTIESNFFDDRVFRRSRSVTVARQERPDTQAAPSQDASGETEPEMNVAGQQPAAGGEETEAPPTDVPDTTPPATQPEVPDSDVQVVNVADDDLLQTLDLSVELLLKGSRGNGTPSEIERAIAKLRRHRALLLERAATFHENAEALKAKAEALRREEHRLQKGRTQGE
ncbi:MAG: hypothetical protein D6795_07510, partial [Deltaproteobacteria bacterium]